MCWGHGLYSSAKRAAAIRSAKSLPALVRMRWLFWIFRRFCRWKGAAFVRRRLVSMSPPRVSILARSQPHIVRREVIMYSFIWSLGVRVSCSNNNRLLWSRLWV